MRRLRGRQARGRGVRGRGVRGRADAIPPEIQDDTLECWFRASKLSGYTGGDAVNPLSDFSGNGANFEQPIISSEMLFRGDYVQADGDDFYEQAPGTYEVNPAALTWIMVARIPTIPTAVGRLIAHRSAVLENVVLYVNSSSAVTMAARDSDAVAPVASTTYSTNLAVFVGYLDVAAGTLGIQFDDGVLVGTEDTGNLFTGDLTATIRNIGCDRNGQAIIESLELYEVATYQRALSASERLAKITYLKSHYGI